MPLSNLLRNAAGICRHCGNKAGVLTRDHPECRRTFDDGWDRMVGLAADAACTPIIATGSPSSPLAEITHNSYDMVPSQARLAGGCRRLEGSNSGFRSVSDNIT